MPRTGPFNGSVWRVPNYLMETRDLYFDGAGDDLIDRLSKWRSLAGAAILAGVTLAYPNLAKSLPSQISGAPGNSIVFYVSNYLANWLSTTLEVVFASFTLIIVFPYCWSSSRDPALGARLSRRHHTVFFRDGPLSSRRALVPRR